MGVYDNGQTHCRINARFIGGTLTLFAEAAVLLRVYCLILLRFRQRVKKSKTLPSVDEDPL
jgi:hypothetical protein